MNQNSHQGSSDADRDSLRERAKRDPAVSNSLNRIIAARQEFEESLVADRLALISAFHETKALKHEVASLSEAFTDPEAAALNVHETASIRMMNDAVTKSHITALKSRRKNAAMALIIAIDRLTDALWIKLGLPEWSVRGGHTVSGDVTVMELLHLCGNYLRHAHEWEWTPECDLKKQAKKNIERLASAGFDYRDRNMLAHVVDALPQTNFMSLEIELLDFMEFISWFTQEKTISVWATRVGESYAICFNDYDHKIGYAGLAVQLNREVGKDWLPSQ
jgi:hypothetical protein